MFRILRLGLHSVRAAKFWGRSAGPVGGFGGVPGPGWPARQDMPPPQVIQEGRGRPEAPFWTAQEPISSDAGSGGAGVHPKRTGLGRGHRLQA